MRKTVVVGNWKMNMTRSEALALVRSLKVKLQERPDVETGVCPPFTALAAVAELLRDTAIGWGGQNMFHEDSGAYTGEISPPMLADLGCRYVILGHSERRQYFGETDEGVAKKVAAAHRHGLTPIVCVGETLQQREAGETETVVAVQVRNGLSGLSTDQMRHTIIAYEPVWAIGTGRTATPEDANAVHATIRTLLAEMFDSMTAETVRIQYGGSVKPSNAADLLSQREIDGALVGGASLKAEDFVAIVKSAPKSNS
ncbi:MAG: triose-phosphate isomerase [Candidatus Hydrogenedentota bacterium]|nr:MAG: triose-phosphate isomerase [Candidatus Hydrogenedentota bacterium]